MGLFSKIFGGKNSIKSTATSVSFLGAYREASGKSYGGGGWGLDRFNSIIEAHSSIEDMIMEWELDQEGCGYMSIDGYDDCYTQAYEEAYQKAQDYIDTLSEVFDVDILPEDIIDYEAVDQKAHNYAEKLCQAWLDGSEWIPEEIMDWAWYSLSSHNG